MDIHVNPTPRCIPGTFFSVLLAFPFLGCNPTAPDKLKPNNLPPPTALSVVSQQSSEHTELGISAPPSGSPVDTFTFGEFIYKSGNYQCEIWGDPWDGVNATIETLVTGTVTLPTRLSDVNSISLVRIMADSKWVSITLASGHYRLKIGGTSNGASINWHCRKVQ